MVMNYLAKYPQIDAFEMKPFSFLDNPLNQYWIMQKSSLMLIILLSQQIIIADSRYMKP